MTANGQTQTFDYFMDMKTDADGWGLLYHEKGLIPNAAPYLGFGMLAFDGSDNTVHIFTVSNYADVHDHKGNWTDDKHFTLIYNGMSEGKTLKEELTAEIVDANTFKFSDVLVLMDKPPKHGMRKCIKRNKNSSRVHKFTSCCLTFNV